MDHAAARRERLARLLPDEGVDALLISNPVNVTYLTGFTGDSSVVVLTPRPRPSSSAIRATPARSPTSAPAWKRTSDRRPRASPRPSAEVLDQARLPLRRLRERRRHRGRVRIPQGTGAGRRVEGRRRPRGTAAHGQGRRRAGADPRRHRRGRTGLHRPLRPAAAGGHRDRTVRTPWRPTSAGPAARRRRFRPSSPSATAPPCRTRRRLISAVSASGLLLVDWGASGPRLQKRLDSGSGHPYKIVFRAPDADAAKLEDVHRGRSGGSGSGHAGGAAGRRGQGGGRRGPRGDRRRRLRRLLQPRPRPRHRLADPRGAGRAGPTRPTCWPRAWSSRSSRAFTCPAGAASASRTTCS